MQSPEQPPPPPAAPTKPREKAWNLNFMLKFDRRRATKLIKAALKKSEGHLSDTAKRLKISDRTLDRILKDHPALSAFAFELRTKATEERQAERATK